MNINRYNYEEFFLLYVDNELTKAERLEVEAFVHANSDLEEELVMLKQSKLRPDASISFQGKEALLKPESAGFINETNYTEFFLLYVDDELTAGERREVESFAASKPQLQQELNILLQTKAEPELDIVFPNKSLLYKEEKKRPVIFIGWQRIVAVAAILLVALGIFWLSGTNSGKQDDIAKNEGSAQQNSVEQKQDDATTGSVAGTTTEPQQAKNETAVMNQPAPQPQIALNDKSNKQLNTAERKNNEQESNNSNLAYQQKKTNETIVPLEQETRTLASVDVTGVERNASNNVNTALDRASISSGVQVTSQPIVQTVAYIEEDNGIDFANVTVDRKNKLRGLFRKVTRVFEKTTNLPAVEERGILIGNLEIALK